jgi:hypothetical protein
VLRGKGVEPEFRSVPVASLWVSLPNPSVFQNPPNTPAVWGSANWLSRRFHFSCDGEWKTGPLNFGPIRFLNDCLMMPKRKMEKMESDVEILTYVVKAKTKVVLLSFFFKKYL